MRFIQWAAILIFISGLIILPAFLWKASFDGFQIFTKLPTDYTTSGQFGDFIGGVVGTFLTLSGTLLIYLTFKEQAGENRREAFESSFFEMIRIHRDNVSELKYKKSSPGELATHEGRDAFKEIFKEFIECYREVKKFSNSSNILDYLTPKYAKELQLLLKRTKRNCDPIEMALIDLSYLITFYGLNTEGEYLVRGNILKKFNQNYYFKLLFFLKLKPLQSDTSRLHMWSNLLRLDLKSLHALIDDLYANRQSLSYSTEAQKFAGNFGLQLPYDKYYSGHDFRLGHYFRHMYQSFKYLHNHSHPTKKDKYGYAKIYRAQLSNSEQALLMVNSISSLGMKWEFTPELSKLDKLPAHLITEYALIKNLPGRHIFGIKYKKYYPKIIYEADEQTIFPA